MGFDSVTVAAIGAIACIVVGATVTSKHDSDNAFDVCTTGMVSIFFITVISRL